MKIKIGDKEFATRKPQDLDQRLIDLTGLNASETIARLGDHTIAGHIAAAIHPYLTDAPAVQEIAAAIAPRLAGNRVEVLNEVRQLYASVVPVEQPSAPPAPPAAEKGN